MLQLRTPPNPKHTQLTEAQRVERAADILDRIKAGYTAKLIASELFCSLTEVYRVSTCTSTRFKHRHRRYNERREVADYYRDNTIKQTMAKFGLSAPTIIKYAKRAGVIKRPGRKKEEYGAGEVLIKCGLQVMREPGIQGKAHYWLIRSERPEGKRLSIAYNPDVLAIRRDVKSWLKANARQINEVLGRS